MGGSGSDPVFTALSQPAVLEAIFHFLPVPSLKACSLVSPTWTKEAIKRLEKTGVVCLNLQNVQLYSKVMKWKARRLNQVNPRPHHVISFTISGGRSNLGTLDFDPDLEGVTALEEREQLVSKLRLISPSVKRLCLDLLYLEGHLIKILDRCMTTQLLPLFPNVESLKIKAMVNFNSEKDKVTRPPPLVKVLECIPPPSLFKLGNLQELQFQIDDKYEAGPRTALKALIRRMFQLREDTTGLNTHLKKVYNTQVLDTAQKLTERQGTVDNPRHALPLGKFYDMIPILLDEVKGSNTEWEGLEEVQVCGPGIMGILTRNPDRFPALRKVLVEFYNADVRKLVEGLDKLRDQLEHVIICINGGARKDVELPRMTRLKTLEIWTSDDIGSCKLHSITFATNSAKNQLPVPYPDLKTVNILSHSVYITEYHLSNLFPSQILKNVEKLKAIVPKLSQIEISFPWEELKNCNRDLVSGLKRTGRIQEGYKSYNSSGFGTRF